MKTSLLIAGVFGLALTGAAVVVVSQGTRGALPAAFAGSAAAPVNESLSGMVEASGPIKGDDQGTYLELLIPYDMAARMQPGTQAQLEVEGVPSAIMTTFRALDDIHSVRDGFQDVVFVRFRLDEGNDSLVNRHGAIRFKA